MNKGLFKKGHSPSVETRRKMSLAKLGSIPANKKPAAFVVCLKCGQSKQIKPAELGRAKFCSSACRNAFGPSDATRQKQSDSKIQAGIIPPSRHGTRLTDVERREKAATARRGENHWNWQGGLTRAAEIVRNSLEYKIWRTAVFTRDNYTCVNCDVRGGKLNADHIKRFADFPDLRFDVNNGRTLCEDCHRKTDTYGNRKNAATSKWRCVATA